MNSSLVIHPIPPVFDLYSRILILGTMPSPKSRETAFYYAHPQNRFWKVLSSVFDMRIGNGKEEKTEFLLSHKIALWDVIKSCEIVGADDSSIRNPQPNDLRIITDVASISHIFTTGTAAGNLYSRYCAKQTGIQATVLPSTSSANAKWSIEQLAERYAVIREALHISKN